MAYFRNIFFVLLLATLIFGLEAGESQVNGVKHRHRHRVAKKPVAPVLPLEMALRKIDVLNGIQFTIPCYAIMTKNGVFNQKYHLILRSLSGEMSVQGSYYIDKEGFLLNESGEGQHLMIFNGFQPGEPVNCYLISEDKKQLTHATLTPWPMTITNRRGKTIKVEVLSHYYTTFSIEASGFLPGDPLMIKTAFEDKTLESRSNATREGTFQHLLVVADRSQETGGQLTFTISSSEGDISMKLPWGSEYEEKGNEFIKRKNEEYLKLKERIASRPRNPSV